MPHAPTRPTLQTRAARALLAPLALLIPLTSAHATGTHYFEGNTRRTITLEPQWVALITPAAEAADASAGAALRARNPQAPAASPQVVLQPAHQTADPAAERSAQRQTTPVYREGTSPAGRLMALPGGVLVKLDPRWSEAQARSWADSKGLTIAQRLNVAGNWYLLASAPGNAALELARQLHDSGEVLTATPNWWKQTQPR